MVRSVQIDIGDGQYTLRRSANNMAAIERRFGSLDLAAIFSAEGGTFAERSEKLFGLLVDLTGGSQPRPTVESLGDAIDPAEFPEIMGKITELFGGDQPQAVNPPFVPTPERLIERMLDVAELKPGEVLFDPCCGDGRTLRLAAARGAMVAGCELHDGRFEQCRKDGYENVLQADGTEADFSRADVVFLYALPGFNQKIQSRLLAQCKDSCRVVSHAFDMPGWTPYHTETFEGRVFYAWRIADVRAQQLNSAAA